MAERTAVRPAILDALRGYSWTIFRGDLTAGVTVGLVALPLAMAFAIASGVPPQVGIYTAIFGALLVALAGGSRTQIAGPTGAFVVIIAAIIAKHGMSGLIVVTLMAGCILVVLGLTGLGSAVKFIPRPVVIGFTNGIALLIVSTQLKDFFGLHVAPSSGEFFARMGALAAAARTIDPATTVVAVASLAVIIAVPRLWPRVPGAIVALVLATTAVALFHVHVATIGTRFGGIAAGLPPFVAPHLSPAIVVSLIPSALTVAILAAVESLLSAVVADSMTGDRHNSNAELFAQGIANVVVPLFGGIPVTGAIARTATNVRAGARTPVAGIVHSVTLLAIVLFLTPLAASIPLAALAAILVVVAYNMSEWREVRAIVRLDKASLSVWFVTCALTVVADLTLAVEVGLALAALLYIYRISQTTTVTLVTPEDVEDGRIHILQDKRLPHYVSIVRIHGPFLFGTTETLLEETADVSRYAPIVVLRLRNMTALDATGLHALEVLHERLKRSGRSLVLCGARDQPARFLRRADFVQRVGAANIQPNVQAALERAARIHDGFGGMGEDLAHDMI
jgi:SulP family sulfate permease